MLFDNQILPPGLALAALVTCLLVLAAALRLADWRALTAAPDRMHWLGASVLLLVLLQALSVPLSLGIYLHLLGVSAVTLIVGLRFTLLAGALAIALYCLFLALSPSAAAMAWWMSVAAPALATRCLVAWLDRRRFPSEFVFVMAAGFGGGVLSALATAAAALAVLTLSQQGALVSVALQNWPVIVLIAIPEGFIAGTVVTALVVFAPDSMKLFNPEAYSGGG